MPVNSLQVRSRCGLQGDTGGIVLEHHVSSCVTMIWNYSFKMSYKLQQASNGVFNTPVVFVVSCCKYRLVSCHV